MKWIKVDDNITKPPIRWRKDMIVIGEVLDIDIGQEANKRTWSITICVGAENRIIYWKPVLAPLFNMSKGSVVKISCLGERVSAATGYKYIDFDLYRPEGKCEVGNYGIYYEGNGNGVNL